MGQRIHGERLSDERTVRAPVYSTRGEDAATNHPLRLDQAALSVAPLRLPPQRRRPTAASSVLAVQGSALAQRYPSMSAETSTVVTMVTRWRLRWMRS